MGNMPRGNTLDLATLGTRLDHSHNRAGQKLSGQIHLKIVVHNLGVGSI